jgi:hypothetical protein
MNTRFQDLEHENNPRNGQALHDRASVRALLNELRSTQPAFMCQFSGDNGFNLMVGIDRNAACVQHSANDGMPPYLMALSDNENTDEREMEFLVGGTATPIDGRYRVTFEMLAEIVSEFVASGERNNNVSWEELDG